jgi:Aerotolerance regulator N-terminal
MEPQARLGGSGRNPENCQAKPARESVRRTTFTVLQLIMGLLYPAALAFFALLPVLVLAYLARERPARVIVSSVLGFRALRGFRRERFGGRPRFDWMFFAELAILSLAVLALAGPYALRRTNPIAVVIDNSAAMQARLSSGQARFQAAIAKASAMLSTFDSASVSIYVTAPVPHRIAPAFDSVPGARAALARLAPTDAPNNYGALSNLLGDLASGPQFKTVIFAGARAISPPVPARLDAIAVGDPASNLALGEFTLRRESFGAAALHASLTVANYSTDTKTAVVTIFGDGKRIATARQDLAAGQSGVMEFASLPPAGVYRAKLAPSDSLALDNVAYATAGAVRSVSILFVSPTPADAAGLDSIPGVRVRTVAPAAFAPAALEKVDLAIFEYSAPKELPTVNSLLVMPPPGDRVFDFRTIAVTSPQIAAWRRTDPLTDSVNFRMLDLHAGEFIALHPWMAAVVSGERGGLLLAGQRAGHRYVAAGFNPFPYLGRRNLPMSVLTLNILSYLAGVGASSGGYRTGQPWLVPAGVDRIELPSGATVAAAPGTLFADTTEQGIYQLIGADGARTQRAVNLDDLAESDLESAPPLHLEPRAAASSGGAIMEKSPLGAFLLAAIIALCALEALLVYRRRRRPVLEA